MIEKINTSALVTARNDYIEHLKKKLSPLIIEGFVSIYKDAYDYQKNLNYEYTYQFQQYLKGINEWNQTILSNETKRILNKLDFNLQRLISAIFITEVKILTSIKIGSNSNEFEIEVPPSDQLIHKIYTNVARKIYNDISVIKKFDNIEHNISSYTYIKCLIEEVIYDTVMEKVPLKHILDEYLNNIVANDFSREEEHENIEQIVGHENIEQIVGPEIESVNIMKENINPPIENMTTIQTVDNEVATIIGLKQGEPDLESPIQNEIPADLLAPTIKIIPQFERHEDINSSTIPIDLTCSIDTNGSLIKCEKVDINNELGTINSENRIHQNDDKDFF